MILPDIIPAGGSICAKKLNLLSVCQTFTLNFPVEQQCKFFSALKLLALKDVGFPAHFVKI